MPLCPKCLHCMRPGDLVVGAQEVLEALAAASLNTVRIVAGTNVCRRISGLAIRSAIAAVGRSDMMTPVDTAETGGEGYVIGSYEDEGGSWRRPLRRSGGVGNSYEHGVADAALFIPPSSCRGVTWMKLLQREIVTAARHECLTLFRGKRRPAGPCLGDLPRFSQHIGIGWTPAAHQDPEAQ